MSMFIIAKLNMIEYRLKQIEEKLDAIPKQRPDSLYKEAGHLHYPNGGGSADREPSLGAQALDPPNAPVSNVRSGSKLPPKKR